ncbi:MAG: DDE-type integrase/transposase/recombinase [Candidatus Micrarchaeota archaeon]
MDKLENKKRYFVRHLEAEPMTRLCGLLRICRKTGYNWLERFQQSGLEGLLKDDPGGRPRKQVPIEISTEVLSIRNQFGYCEKRIHEELGRKVSYHAIRQSLAGLLRPAPFRKKRTFRHFERPLPNHLWQCDFSLLDDGSWLFALLDDYSRYLVDAMEFEEASTENALFVVRRAFRMHGTPFQLMTDHGVQFWNNTRKQRNAFGEILEVLGTEHILAGVKRPQTNGKMERWFGSYKEESPHFRGLSEYAYHYNFCRPHGGIGYAKPFERYFAFKL